VFKKLIVASLQLHQPKRGAEIWKEMEKYSILPDNYCFGLLTRVCAKIEDSALAKKLFLKVKNKELKFDINVIDCAQLI